MKFTAFPQTLPANDVLGSAIYSHWLATQQDQWFDDEIAITINGHPDDPMHPSLFFREHLHPDCSGLPEGESLALQAARGKVLDLGAGSGCHSIIARGRGHHIVALDASSGCVKTMKARGLDAVIQADFHQWQTTEKFETILLLMNGLGMAGSRDGIPIFLDRMGELLVPGGSIIGETTSIEYMRSDWGLAEEESTGDVRFDLSWKEKTQSFDWVFIGEQEICREAQSRGFSCEVLWRGSTHNAIVRLRKF